MDEAALLSKVKHAKCATLFGNKAYEVGVESTLVRALPGFSIVGIADQSIQESHERIKSALSSINFQKKKKKINDFINCRRFVIGNHFIRYSKRNFF